MLNNIDRAYGITIDTIEESCNGFFIDDDSDWDIYLIESSLIRPHGRRERDHEAS